MLRRRRSKLKFLLIIIIIAGLTCFFIIERSLRSTIESVAEAQATWSAVSAINTAVLEKVAANIQYTDLIKPEKDGENRVIFMQINTMLVNRIRADAELEIQHSLQQLQQNKFQIPLGQILGSKLLANFGPAIKLIMLPIGTVNVDVADSFEEAGINQTRHKIYLIVKSKVKVIIPLISSEVPIETKIPIADAVIVGPVPQFYVGESLFK